MFAARILLDSNLESVSKQGAIQKKYVALKTAIFSPMSHSSKFYVPTR